MTPHLSWMSVAGYEFISIPAVDDKTPGQEHGHELVDTILRSHLNRRVWTHRWLSSGWIHTSTGGWTPVVGCLLDGSTHLQEGNHPSLVDFLGEGVGIERLCLLIHVDPGGGQNRLYAPNRWCANTDRIFRWPLGWSSVCVRWFGWLRGTDKDRIWFPPSVV